MHSPTRIPCFMPHLFYTFFTLTRLANIHRFLIYAPYFGLKPYDWLRCDTLRPTCSLILMEISFVIYAFLFPPPYSGTQLARTARAFVCMYSPVTEWRYSCPCPLHEDLLGVEVQPNNLLPWSYVECEWSVSHPGCFTPEKNAPTPLERRMGGPQSRSARFGDQKNFFPLSWVYWKDHTAPHGGLLSQTSTNDNRNW
jgi:hypothetical protein